MEKEDKQQTFTREGIAAFIEKDRDERLRRCLELINAAQEETRCKITANVIVLQGGHLSAEIMIVDNDEPYNIQ